MNKYYTEWADAEGQGSLTVREATEEYDGDPGLILTIEEDDRDARIHLYVEEVDSLIDYLVEYRNRKNAN